ncbi:MAG: hypothetical protein HZC41_11455 [Chloroflexi bacterium]|nr:hypothetical protein [Chloroflexota bacterium]
MNPLLLTLPLLLLAGLMIVLPRGTGCLVSLARTGALLVGALAPLLLVWHLAGWPRASVISVALTVVALALNVAALTLISLGWQTLTSGSQDVVDAMPASLFDPNTYISNIGGSSTSADDLGCMLAGFVLGGLFLLGFIIGGFAEKYLMPPALSGFSRFSRLALSLGYGIALHVGLVLVLHRILTSG